MRPLPGCGRRGKTRAGGRDREHLQLSQSGPLGPVFGPGPGRGEAATDHRIPPTCKGNFLSHRARPKARREPRICCPRSCLSFRVLRINPRKSASESPRPAMWIGTGGPQVAPLAAAVAIARAPAERVTEDGALLLGAQKGGCRVAADAGVWRRCAGRSLHNSSCWPDLHSNNG